METPKILMGRNNPNGWKLEAILQKLREEVAEKSDLIRESPHPQKDMIIEHNQQIMNYLLKAQRIQEDTYSQMDRMEPNRGPLSPRL